MKLIRLIYLILLTKFSCILHYSDADDVLGCGGFIKSHADIDFSRVEVKLLTRHGSLKDKTDCSPSNGYYFLPIYDKGEYLLQVSPPPGWSFEPQQVELNFDGKNDICSQGNDVNFVFKGFGITGKVALAGQGSSGAHGVSVHLISEVENEERQVVTNTNGIFSFTPIIPGKYKVYATHPRWHFFKSEHNVLVESGNTELPENALVVGGFDVLGNFNSNGQLTAGIKLAIFRKKGQTLPLLCDQGTHGELSVNNSNYEELSVCQTSVDKKGTYVFKGVPPGKYLVQPILESASHKLHITPIFIELEVEKDTLYLKDEFKITGFTVAGKILNSPSGSPIEGAVIILNDEAIAKSDKDGKYMIENVKPGYYKLRAKYPHYQFGEQGIDLKVNTQSIDDLVPVAYEVCGKVVSQKSYVVGITKHSPAFHTTVSSKPESGDWCTYLPSGKYNIEVLITDQEKNSGIQFFPVQQQIDVQYQPLNDILFSQLRAILSGEVKCLSDASESCTAAEITLYLLNSEGQRTGHSEKLRAKDGKYVFQDILPGAYEVTIRQENLCFDSTTVFVNVDTVRQIAPPFLQRGYEVTIISSHRSIMKYSYTGTGAPVPQQQLLADTIKLLTGVNTFCVPTFGTYKFKLEGCHLYDENLPSTFNTADKNPVIITATAHKIGVRVLSSDANIEYLRLLVESKTVGKQIITPISEAHKVDGKYAFRYDTHLQPQEVIHITPKSDILLFSPQTKELIGGNDCVDVAFNFVATRGLIIKGKVVPALANATIILSYPDNLELSTQILHTNINGEFKFGPINENIKYELKAEKESYVFSEYNWQTSSFEVHKLCEIIVSVKDEVGKKLSGVLLSLSGAESYRRNLITAEDPINFHSLSPSRYFLRPMMKEYKFEPSSKIIDIKDGETINLKFIGKRVAFSIFGSINSLNGEPFGQINIEALADESCQHHQEETTSESNGQYRLRGLQPGCTYVLKPKDAGRPDSNIARSIPETRIVKIAEDDIRGVNLIAISPITFVDVIVRVSATLNEHYKSFRIFMYRKGTSDSPIYSQRVETPLNTKSNFNPGIMVFLPRIPLDGKSYIVELKSTLSDKTYSYILPTETFVADTSSIFIEMNFKPEIRTAEADLNQNSISALILVALVSIAFFKQDIAMDFLNFIWNKGNDITRGIAQKQEISRKKEVRNVESINQRKIDKIADQINAISKKKVKRI